MYFYKKNGINLVVLVITVIVMLILIGTVIILFKDNGIFDKAKQSVFGSDVDEFREELNTNLVDKQIQNRKFDKETVNATWDGIGDANIQTWISKFSEEYKDKLQIVSGELVYIGDDNKEIEIIEDLNLRVFRPISQDVDINVGDYVEYIPEGDDSYSNLITVQKVDGVKWRVLKKDSINIVLISETPLGNIQIVGANGYAFGATELDQAFQKIYSSNIGIARSLNVDDINSITGFDGNNEINWKYYDINNIFTQIPTGVRTVGQLENTLGITMQNKLFSPVLGKNIDTYVLNYYIYQGSIYSQDKEIEYNLIFRNTDNTGYISRYWLSSTCTGAFYYGLSGVAFFLYNIVEGSVGPELLYDSTGSIMQPSYAGRPIVILNSNIQINKDVSGDGTILDPWKLKIM